MIPQGYEWQAARPLPEGVCFAQLPIVGCPVAPTWGPRYAMATGPPIEGPKATTCHFTRGFTIGGFEGGLGSYRARGPSVRIPTRITRRSGRLASTGQARHPGSRLRELHLFAELWGWPTRCWLLLEIFEVQCRYRASTARPRGAGNPVPLTRPAGRRKSEAVPGLGIRHMSEGVEISKPSSPVYPLREMVQGAPLEFPGCAHP